MTKIVPDPPLTTTRRKPVYTAFGCCNGNHPPLFSVCEGIELEDALVHLSLQIQCAKDTTAQACERADEQFKTLLIAAQQSLEMSNVLIDSMLDAMEANAAPQ
ncbi:DUF3077 domain-containing protein [Pseudomonas sp. FBF18]|uniref:DUF6124 family protein n=1 Tax=Pseudomonas TaxID=286 RepID=UPI0006D3EDA6|nr:MULTISPECIES: DUF3077 domain-containing protein [Pseudomonas]MCP8347387.1 DUF3077 domain-containing protein [Pseudomonas sp. FBF18]